MERIALSCLLALLLTLPATAQEEPPAEADGNPAEERAPACYVRVWTLFDSPETEVSVQILSKDGGVTNLTGPVPARIETPGYLRLAPGTVTFNLLANGKPAAALTSGLAKDGYYTLAVIKDGDKFQLRGFDDNPSKLGSGTKRVRFFNFAEGRKTSYRFPGQPPVALAHGEIKTVEIPPKLYGININTEAPAGGLPAISEVEIDLTGSRKSASVLISPDYRQRIRPNLIFDGPTPVEQPLTP